MPALLTSEEAARRLGVRRETVYAYVSRGVLARHVSSTRHCSLFDREAVERLAARARRTDRSGALEVVVDSELTLLDPDGHLYFRGHDAVELARFRSFEQVAALLWDDHDPVPWELTGADAETVANVGAALPATVSNVDRVPVIVAALGAGDPRRADRRPETARRVAAAILAGILDGLPAVAAPIDRTAAARLWPALSSAPAPPGPKQLAALNAALVLLADHELAASTLAARVAASAWAGPYRAVLAGLGPLGGTLHGGASRDLEALLAEATAPRDVPALLDHYLSSDAPPSGFGHRVYRDRDPRADHLLARIPSIARTPRATDTVTAFLTHAAARGLPAPNVDTGLAALSFALGLRVGSASTIFTVARTAGLIAHSLEEYPHRLRFRPRATYVGPAPKT